MKAVAYIIYRLDTMALAIVTLSLKGGNPAARSRTATLLRLSASHEFYLRPAYTGLRVLLAPIA